MTSRTEHDALKAWCPFVRTYQIDPEIEAGNGYIPGINRTPSEQAIGHCLGSRCMAWRWGTDPSGDNRPTQWDFSAERPPGDGWQAVDNEDDPEITARWKRPNPHRRGYCGLAGRPE